MKTNPSAFQTWIGKVQNVEFSTVGGTSLLKFTLRYPESDLVEDEDSGERKWKTVNKWSPFLVLWGARAEGLAKIMKKGMTFSAITHYDQTKKETDTGTKYYTNFTVTEISVIDWSCDDDAEDISTFVPDESFDDEDIPF